MEKIISAIFKVESEGYQAMTELKNSPVTDSYTVPQAVLIKKENGRVVTLDSFDTGMNTTDDTLMGGLLGALVGILGGPLGMLLGGSIGALTGGALDAGDAMESASLIERVTDQFVDGEVVLIALEQDADDSAVKEKLSKFDVTIVENDAAEVAEEIRVAVETQKELEREARERLRASREEEFQKNIDEKRAKLKADFESFKEKFKKQ